MLDPRDLAEFSHWEDLDRPRLGAICTGAGAMAPEWETFMTPEERQLLGGLFQRVASTASTPRDAEAEAFINDAVRMQPHAPYALAQTVLVQQQALEAAAKRIQDLEAQPRQGQPPPQEETSFLGNLGRSLFGGQSAPPSQQRSGYDASAYAKPPSGPQSQPYAPQQNYAPPQQGYAPQPNYAPAPGPWGAPPPSGGGGGFLQSALTTAAGVAGGVMVADSLRNLFGGHSGFGAGGFGGAGGLGALGGGNETNETVINNYYDSPQSSGGDRDRADFMQDDSSQNDMQDVADNSDDFSNDDNSSFDT
jgi:uncharacterized protein